MKFIKPKPKNAGDKTEIEYEKIIPNLDFNVFKFNNRPKKSPRNTLIICSLAEFGCETVSTMHIIPHLLRQYGPGYYSVVVGWYGREYFYRHLVDEFWELKEEHQWLREYCRAFHHESKNLANLEKELSQFGRVVPSVNVGYEAVGAKCKTCGAFWGCLTKVKNCISCGGTNVEDSFFANPDKWKPFGIQIPRPSQEKIEAVRDKYLKPNSVGIFARGRKCYGRNLQPEFYSKLIKLLERLGYNPIWLGEKTSTLPCPEEHIVDFSRLSESRDLETTLAIICNLKFTVQFWTASTRLASMMGIPYLLFESPDQIWGTGQEGYRRELCDYGPSKLVASHFLNVYDDNDAGINLVEKCIAEMEEGNYEDVMGLIESELAVSSLREERLFNENPSPRNC